VTASDLKGFVALRSRDFRLLVAGQVVSITGSQMQHVAVVWQLYLLTHSAMSLGLLGLFRAIPILVFSLGGGVVADAFNRRKLMLFSQSAMALSSVGLALATLTGHVSVGVIYGAAFVSGTAAAFDSPARQALIQSLVPREHLANALSIYATMWQVARVAGPAVGGLLIGWTGVLPIYVLDAGSFLAVIAALVMMRNPPPSRGMSAVNVRALGEGISFLRGNPLIWTTMLLDFMGTFFGSSTLLMPIFADQILHVGPHGLGMLYSAEPVGAGIAGLFLASRGAPRNRIPAIVGSVMAYGGAIVVFGFSTWFPLSLLAMAGAGAADTVSMVLRQTLRQSATPDALQGRMTSVNLLFVIGGPQLGEVEAGFVARFLGAPFASWSGGIACIVAAGILGLYLRKRGLWQTQAVTNASEIRT